MADQANTAPGQANDELASTTDAASQPDAPPRLRVLAGKRAGRSHRQRGDPCQDSFAVDVDPAGGRAVAAVADGLGSRPLSHLGSQAACDAAVASLRAEPAWDRAAMLRAFEAAAIAVRDAAARHGLGADDLATTLQVAAVSGGRVLAAMVGDGAIVGGDPVAVAVAPPQSGYANEVFPLTQPGWREHLQVAEQEFAGPVLLFTDGLTRLLLARSRAGWTPFAPFFASFLPRLPRGGDGFVQAFLDGDQVDQSWDDDKCLVVIHRAA
ncbi:MAG: PP2C family serine/threonine-protein phosphatase [Candidatus Thermoplasmatota archaeon]